MDNKQKYDLIYWLREIFNNADFNSIEFDRIKNLSGSPKKRELPNEYKVLVASKFYLRMKLKDKLGKVRNHELRYMDERLG